MPTEQNIRKVLVFLDEATKSNMSLEEMAKKHFAYEKQINDLLNQLEAAETKKADIDNSIFLALNKMKGKTVKFGRILMKIKRTRTVIKGKNTYSWKGIAEEIQETFELEQRILQPILRKHFKPAQDTVRVSDDLVIKKESIEVKALIQHIEKKTGKKVVFKEGVWDSLRAMGKSIMNIFQRIFPVYSNKVDALEKMLSEF